MATHSLTINFLNWTLPIPLLAQIKGDTDVSAVGSVISATVDEHYDPLPSLFDPFPGPQPGINYIRVPNVFPKDSALGNPHKLGENYSLDVSNAGLDFSLMAEDDNTDDPRWYCAYDKIYNFYFKTFRLDNVWSDTVNEFPLVGRAVPLGYGRWGFLSGLDPADLSSPLTQQSVWTADAESWYPYQLTDTGGRATYCALVAVSVGQHFHLEGYVPDRGDGHPNYHSYDPFGSEGDYIIPLPGSDTGWVWTWKIPNQYTETLESVEYTRSWQNIGFYPYYLEKVEPDKVNDSPPDKYNQYYDSTWKVDYSGIGGSSGTLAISDGTTRKRTYLQRGRVDVFESDGTTRIPCNVTFGAYSGTDNSLISAVPKGSLLDNVRDDTGHLTHLHLRSTSAYLSFSPVHAPVELVPPRYFYSPAEMDLPDNPENRRPFDVDADDGRHAPFWKPGWGDLDVQPPELVYAKYESKDGTDLNTVTLWKQQTETERLEASTSGPGYFFTYNEFFGGEVATTFYDVTATEIASPHRRFKGKLWIHEDQDTSCTLDLAPEEPAGPVALTQDIDYNVFGAAVVDNTIHVYRRIRSNTDLTDVDTHIAGLDPSIYFDAKGVDGRLYLVYSSGPFLYIARNDTSGIGSWSANLVALGLHGFIEVDEYAGIAYITYWRDGVTYFRTSRNGISLGNFAGTWSSEGTLVACPEQQVQFKRLPDTDNTFMAVYTDADGNLQTLKSTDNGATWS